MSLVCKTALWAGERSGHNPGKMQPQGVTPGASPHAARVPQLSELLLLLSAVQVSWPLCGLAPCKTSIPCRGVSLLPCSCYKQEDSCSCLDMFHVHALTRASAFIIS
jgi:hypothetical protein